MIISHVQIYAINYHIYLRATLIKRLYRLSNSVGSYTRPRFRVA